MPTIYSAVPGLKADPKVIEDICGVSEALASTLRERGVSMEIGLSVLLSVYASTAKGSAPTFLLQQCAAATAQAHSVLMHELQRRGEIPETAH